MVDCKSSSVTVAEIEVGGAIGRDVPTLTEVGRV